MPIEVKSLAELESKISEAGGKLVLLYFGALWCRPCKIVGPKLAELEKEYTNMTILKIDAEEADELCFIFGVEMLPSFICIKETLVLYELHGSNIEKLIENIQKYYNCDVKTLKEKPKTYINMIEAGYKKVKEIKALIASAASLNKDGVSELPVTTEIKGKEKPGTKTGKPKVIQPKPDETKTGKPKPDQTKTDKPKPGQIKTDKSITDQPKTDKSITDKIKTDKSITDKIKTDRSITDQPKTNKSVPGQPKTDKPKPGPIKIDKSITDQPKTDPSHTGRPKTGQSKTAKSKPEQPEGKGNKLVSKKLAK